jgi:hypothetical protein
MFNVPTSCFGLDIIRLAAGSAPLIVNDTLVLTVDVAVEREDRFQLDTGAEL